MLEREVARQFEGEVMCCGVTLTQCHTLLELEKGELSLGALAAALGLDASTLSRTVDVLVKANLIERAQDPADRRAIRLKLTEAGRERVAFMNQTANGYWVGLLGQLSEKDRQCVTRAVAVLGKLMQQARGGTASGAPGCGCKKEG